MNHNQKTVLLVALVLAALMAAFPPWTYRETVGDGAFLYRNAGYICIFTPPSTQDYKRVARLFGYKDDCVLPAEPVTRENETQAASQPPPVTYVNGLRVIGPIGPVHFRWRPVTCTAAEKVAKAEWSFRVSIDLSRLLVQLLTLLLVTASAALVLQGPRKDARAAVDGRGHREP
jgi:hypothetical protein